MKKLIVTVLVIALLGFGYYQLRGVKLRFASQEGKTTVVQRGDVTIPITALGEVAPASRREIKSKASGEVVEILHLAGDPVRKDDLLIRLKKDDEERSVNRNKAEVTRSKASLERARITLEQTRTVTRAQAEARVAQLQEKLKYAKFTLDKNEELDQQDRASPEELIRAQTTYGDLSAQLDAAKADLEDVKLAVQKAEQDVILAEAVHEQALTALAEAQQRLEETDIVSPVDGIVVSVNTQVGEVIQGGVSTITGGTVLAVVADCSKLYVQADVDEADIGAVRDLAPEWARPGVERPGEETVPVKTGTLVEITFESFRDEVFEGVIERIHPEPNSRASSVVTYRVDVVLTSPNREKLLGGMQADVKFTAESVSNAVLVPHDAIRKNEFDKLGVYVAVKGPEGELKPEFVPCRFGLDNGISAEVLEGVEEGATVYTVLPKAIGGEDEDDKSS